MYTRRFYERLKTNINAVLYIGNSEYDVVINNISENGIGFSISVSDNLPDIPSGTFVRLTFVDLDYFNYCNAEKLFENYEQNYVQSIKCSIVHMQKEQSTIYYGAKIISDNKSYDEYVLNKKSIDFITNNVKTGQILQQRYRIKYNKS